MASKLNPYLNVLDGLAREALEFYQAVLGGELTIMTFGDMGTEGPIATQVTQPLEPAPWGDEFGMLVDRFGISWMVNIAGGDRG